LFVTFTLTIEIAERRLSTENPRTSPRAAHDKVLATLGVFQEK